MADGGIAPCGALDDAVALGRDLERLLATAPMDEFPRRAWAHGARCGLMCLGTEPDHRPRSSAVRTVEVLMALGESCTDGGFLFSVGAQLWSSSLVLSIFGSAEQRARYLPGLRDGSVVGSTAMTEEAAGSDLASMTTRAERRPGGGFVLRGRKSFVTNGPIASFAVVFARTDGRPPFDLTAFVVERTDPGVAFGGPLAKVGLDRAQIGTLELDNVRLDESRLLGKVGGGLGVFRRSMRAERGYLMAPLVGTLTRHIGECVRALQDAAAGAGDLQRHAHTVADMKVRRDAAEALLRTWAGQLDDQRDGNTAASVAKLFVSESLVRSCTDALRIVAPAGRAAAAIESDLRDSLAATIYAGTSEVQRNVIAEDLGLRAATRGRGRQAR